jgi:3-deoxy-manno-octulosonate cytidylyltransferase (CMP-KDO synthetase)
MIPARLDSSRLPGKLMMDLNGKSVILTTLENTIKTKLFDDVYVVTDSKVIYDHLKQFHKNVLISSKKHISGSDRIAEIAQNLEVDVVINVQGDEPFVDKKSLKNLIDVFTNDKNKTIDLASLMEEIKDQSYIEDPNIVKVIVDSNCNAIYFSRSAIPYNRLDKSITYYKHVGVYAFRKNALIEFTNSEPTELEKIEKLEQLRYIERGKTIKMVLTTSSSIGIDTISDLEKARKYDVKD